MKLLPNIDQKEWIELEQVATLIGTSKRTIERQVLEGLYETKTVVAEGGPGGIKTLVDKKSLPAEAQNRILDSLLTQTPQKMDKAIRPWFSLPIERQEDAIERLKLVNQVREIKGAGRGATGKIRELAAANDMSLRNLQRLVKKADDALAGVNGSHPDLIQALSLIPRNGRRAGRGQSFASEAVVWMAENFGTEQRPNLQTVYEALQNEAVIRDWKIGTYESLRRIRSRIFSPSLDAAGRTGMQRWQAGRGIKIKRDYREIWPNFMWVGDHHIFDVFVNYRNRTFRPWITAWMDLRSRALAGWAIVIKPSSYSIALALRHACMAKDHKYFPMCGAPASVYIDNGKDYRCKYLNGEEITIGKIDYPEIIRTFYNLGIDPFYIDLEYDPAEKAWVKQRGKEALQVKTVQVGGVYSRLGIRPRYATVYHPWAKTIERSFRNVVQEFSRQQPGWCGSHPGEKPEKLAWEIKSGRLLDLEEFIDRFFHWVVDVYHRRPQTGHGMDGMSPYDVYTTMQAEEIQAVPEELLEFVLSRKERVKMHNWGFNLNGREYELDVPTSYRGAAIWDRLIEQYISVLYDASDPRRVKVFFDGRYWCDAIPLRRGSFIDDKVMKEKIKLQGYQRQFIKDQLQLIRGGPKPDLPEERLSVMLDMVPHAETLLGASKDNKEIEGKSLLSLGPGSGEDELPAELDETRESGQSSDQADAPPVEAATSSLETCSGDSSEARGDQTEVARPEEPPIFIDESSRYLWLLESRVAGAPIDQEDNLFMAEFEEREEYQMLTQYYSHKEEEFQKRYQSGGAK